MTVAMLVIRNDQMNAFRENILRSVAAQALAEWPVPHAPSYEVIRPVIARALNYGLRSREHLLRFLAIAGKRGLQFDLDPELKKAADILNDADLAAALKIGLLETLAGVKA